MERPGPAREQAAIPSVCLAARRVAASPRTGQIRDASDGSQPCLPARTAGCASELNIPPCAGRVVILGMPDERNGCIVCVEELLIEVELGNIGRNATRTPSAGASEGTRDSDAKLDPGTPLGFARARSAAALTRPRHSPRMRYLRRWAAPRVPFSPACSTAVPEVFSCCLGATVTGSGLAGLACSRPSWRVPTR